MLDRQKDRKALCNSKDRQKKVGQAEIEGALSVSRQADKKRNGQN